MKNKSLLIIGSAIFILLMNLLIIDKEHTKSTATEVYIPLAPVDPRSLIQGDYMSLRYKIDDNIVGRQQRGLLKFTRDSDGFASNFTLYKDETLKKDEYILKYRKKKYRGLHIGSESFLFEEGKAKYYAKATHAAFYLARDGSTILKDLYVPLRRIKRSSKR